MVQFPTVNHTGHVPHSHNSKHHQMLEDRTEISLLQKGNIDVQKIDNHILNNNKPAKISDPTFGFGILV